MEWWTARAGGYLDFEGSATIAGLAVHCKLVAGEFILRRRVSVSLVMPVRNESPRVAATMEAILGSSRLPDEIIVADGLSTDDTVARFNAYQGRGVEIRVVNNPAIYSGGGRNAGARESTERSSSSGTAAIRLPGLDLRDGSAVRRTE